jgi:hypothetical protein
MSFEEILLGRLKVESRKYFDLREEMRHTRADRDKVMKRLRLLKELLALDGREVILPTEK